MDAIPIKLQNIRKITSEMSKAIIIQPLKNREEVVLSHFGNTTHHI